MTDEMTRRLNELWHRSLRLPLLNELEAKYPRLQDLSPVEIGILNLLHYQPEVIFREIGERFYLPKSSLTNLADRLEKRGLVRRVISPRDRRSFGLELTAEGQAAQDEHEAYEREVCGRILGALGQPAAQEQFLDLLEKLIAGLEHENAGVPARPLDGKD